MSGSARKSGMGFAARGRDFLEGSSDGADGLIPLIRRRRVLGEKSVADRHATEIETDDPRAGGMEGVDHLQTSPAEVDMEAGTWSTRKAAGGECDQSALLVTAEKLDRFF